MVLSEQIGWTLSALCGCARSPFAARLPCKGKERRRYRPSKAADIAFGMRNVGRFANLPPTDGPFRLLDAHIASSRGSSAPSFAQSRRLTKQSNRRRRSRSRTSGSCPGSFLSPVRSRFEQPIQYYALAFSSHSCSSRAAATAADCALLQLLEQARRGSSATTRRQRDQNRSHDEHHGGLEMSAYTGKRRGESTGRGERRGSLNGVEWNLANLSRIRPHPIPYYIIALVVTFL